MILQNQRLRIPILDERPFELKAEFQTAQAVVPGQGQTIRVAGVRVGDVGKVELVDGAGVVTFAIDREFLPIYRDATILMRPATGLKDMFFQLDPGSARARRRTRRGRSCRWPTRRLTSTSTTCSPSLDSETRSYLRLLLVGVGKGLDDRDRELGTPARQPRADQPQHGRAQQVVAKRRDELARFTHNTNVLTTRSWPRRRLS